jgi:protocatechuate 3,4-dioxygenase beta subunit
MRARTVGLPVVVGYLVIFVACLSVGRTTAFAQDIQPGAIYIQTSQAPGPPGGPARDPNAPPPPVGTATIRGRVTAADSGTPLRRAQVRITSPELRLSQSAATDADGRYAFTKMPAARYQISVSRNGFVSLQYGQTRPFEGGKTLSLSDGETAEKIDFALPHGSVITGRITDETGEPVSGVRVQAMRYQYMPSGERQLVPAYSGGFVGPLFNPVTDDLGQFRLFGLMPGTYVVSATMQTNMFMMGPQFGPAGAASVDDNNGYLTTYYPGTANQGEAQGVTVSLGQEANAFFALVPARLARISGAVRNSQGRPATGVTLMLMTKTIGMGVASGTMIGPDGTFTLANVAPGEHVLEVAPQPRGPMAMSADSPQEPEFASVPITVTGQDISGLTITTAPGATITGRVIFDGKSPVQRMSTGPNASRILPSPASPGAAGPSFAIGSLDNGVVDESGRFQIRGVNGRIVFRPVGLQGWYLKSVTLNGVDITDLPYEARGSTPVTGLDVVLTDRQTTLTGTVKDASGKPVKDYTVAVVPDNLPDGTIPMRFIRTVRPDQQGQYKTQGLPAGDYVVFAVESLDQGGVYDPAYQQLMRPRGKTFRLRDGESATVDLQLIQ